MSPPGIVAAFAGGLLSFLSPCVLPLVPGYLSFISGYSVAGPGLPRERSRIFFRSLFFVAGFTVAFTALGTVFSGGAMFAGGSTAPRFLGIASGILVFLFGLNMIFDFLSFLNRELRFHPKGKDRPGRPRSVTGPGGAFVMGLAFAAGWSPCIGPILASILLYAGKDGNIIRSLALLGAYSLGLALPFLAASLFFEKLKPMMDYIKRHGRGVRIVSGLLLLAFGAAMAAGSLPGAGAAAVQLGLAIRAAGERAPAALRLGGGAVFLLAAILIGFGAFRKNRGEAKKSWFLRAVVVLLVLFALLQVAGLVDLTSLIADWLLFSGA